MQHPIPDRHKSSQNYSVRVSDKGIPYGIDTEGLLTINRRLWNCLIFINGPAENEANHHDPEVRTPQKCSGKKYESRPFQQTRSEKIRTTELGEKYGTLCLAIL